MQLARNLTNMKSFYNYIHSEEKIKESVDLQINGIRKLSTDSAEKIMSALHLWVPTKRLNGNQWLVELIPLIKRYNVCIKLGKNSLENTNTLDFFQIDWLLWASFSCTYKTGRQNFRVHICFWEMEEEKSSSGGQMKYLVFKKEEKRAKKLWGEFNYNSQKNT